VPSRCPQCHDADTIELQHSMKGASVLLSWTCGECEAEWPVSSGEPEFIERRNAQSDRRRTTRRDRRKQA